MLEAGTNADALEAIKASKVATKTVFMVELNGKRDGGVNRCGIVLANGDDPRSSHLPSIYRPSIAFADAMASSPHSTCRRSTARSAFLAEEGSRLPTVATGRRPTGIGSLRDHVSDAWI